jgi:hypothetical protein
MLLVAPGKAAELLEGEFGDIDLGRRLVEPSRFPTLAELREAVRRPEITPVLLFKLFGNDKNHHLPVWSGDGRRLAFQRSEVDVRSSRLLMYASMALPEPALVTNEADAYDYMFRWAVNSPASYTFVRIREGAPNTRVFVAGDDGKPQSKLSREGRYGFPALYVRTDGIWRMVYQESGQVMHQAWNAQGPVEDAVALLRGTAPCWSRDGSRMLVARQRPGRDSDPVFDIVVWNLRTEKETPLPAGTEGIVRSPVWSPDERLAAFYVRESGEGKRWRVRICPVDGARAGQTVSAPAVVNMTFESACPAWEASGRRVWFFSEEQHHEAYYPIVAADAQTGQLAVIHYPNRCTNPSDLAINPITAVPEVAFVGHDGLPQDLFILFMNHY